ncbi:MAG: FISUMP domain-containing protein [Calothrix sp. MO_167.B42]|nr:FISUMP domain-containing protein [Calothrix sp. MO_167.B42]
MKTINALTILLVIALLGQSCRKDSDELITTPPTTEPEIKVLSSVVGTVIDAQGNTIEGAAVTFEDDMIFTDENGVFQFRNEELYSTGTFISVRKDGFFDGSRRFYPSPGKTSIITVELIRKNIIGQFDAMTGNTISFENVELEFEANSIMNSDLSPFTGNVFVAAKYLDPTQTSTLNQMPGDLTGISRNPSGIAASQNRVVLSSFAMMAVELYDDIGNPLQVQDGKSVEAKIPIPEDLLSNAPESIPMWYFDEHVGSWIEEGVAFLENGMYEASIPHFTFWNCDIPNELVFLKGSVQNRGFPIPNVNVVVTAQSNLVSASSLTDSEGFFCGYVPKNESLTVTVLDKCGNEAVSIMIQDADEDIILDPIELLLESNFAAISGSVVSCASDPSEQTYVSIVQGTLNNILTMNSNFTFSGNISYCDQSDVVIRIVDPLNAVASESINFAVSNSIDVGEVTICADNSQLLDPRDGEKYLVIEINGQIWTAENIRFDTDDGISNAYDIEYDEVPDHYGRLYNYYSAQEACPDGWHLPSKDEFEDLVSFLELSGPAGFALKSAEDWQNGGNGSNSSGFNAFPVGIDVFGSLDYTGRSTSFWSSDRTGSTGSGLNLGSDTSDASIGSNTLELGFSVRCIKD